MHCHGNFGYSSENLLVSANVSGVQTYLKYDPLMRLYQTNSTGIPVARFAYDGLNALAEYNSSGVLQRRWVFDPTTGQPVIWYEGTGTGATSKRYLSADERGSIISVSDNNGASLGINSYDEYGIPAATNLGRYGYTGQAWLGPAKLWYLNARVYDSKTGTFYQPDPIGYAAGMNVYIYTGGDPVKYVDPLGLKRLVCRYYPWTYTNPWFPESNTTYYDRECGWEYEASDFTWGNRRPGIDPLDARLPLLTNPSPPPPPAANPVFCPPDNSFTRAGDAVQAAGTFTMGAGGLIQVGGAGVVLFGAATLQPEIALGGVVGIFVGAAVVKVGLGLQGVGIALSAAGGNPYPALFNSAISKSVKALDIKHSRAVEYGGGIASGRITPTACRR